MDVAMRVLVDMLRRSTFVPEEIEKERQVIAEEIKTSRDTPEELVQPISEVQWPDSPAATSPEPLKAWPASRESRSSST